MQAHAPRRLVITADDFGLSPAVTEGILEAHAAGAVTATSALVQLAGWEGAVRGARSAPSLDVGLHFNLLLRAPLSRAPSLTMARTGLFCSLGVLLRRALSAAIDAGEVEAECEAQLAALGAAGIRATHIDSHRHVHALPRIHAAVAAVAARHGIPLRRPLESPRWFPLDVAARARGALVAASWFAASRGVPATRHTDHFVGISLQGGTRFADRIPRVMRRLEPGVTELMVHPGRVDDPLRDADAYTWQRECELAVLTSAEFGSSLRASGVELTGFRAL